MKKIQILLTLSALTLGGISYGEPLLEENPLDVAAADEEETPFSRLYVREAAERGRLPEGFSGSWEGEIIGDPEPLELRLGRVGKGFTGVLKVGGEESQLIAPLIARHIAGDGIKFVVPLDSDAGEMSFELVLEGKALKGQLHAPDLSDERVGVIFRKRGDGKPAKAGEAKKLGGHWKGSFEGVAQLDLSLEENEKGFEGLFSMAINGGADHAEMEVPLGKTHREGKEIKFVVSDKGDDDGWFYHLVVEGDILTGYQQSLDDPKDRKWVAFERRDLSKKTPKEK